MLENYLFTIALAIVRIIENAYRILTLPYHSDIQVQVWDILIGLLNTQYFILYIFKPVPFVAVTLFVLLNY